MATVYVHFGKLVYLLKIKGSELTVRVTKLEP
jgi:hypothetical protein